VEIAEEARRRLIVPTRVAVTEVDVFAPLGIAPTRGRWGGLPVTEKQAGVLVKAGIPLGTMDRGQASAVIDALFARRARGLCTYRQAQTLLRFGYAPDVSFREASQTLDAIAANGWRRPDPVTPPVLRSR
jgi:hypothetical protein